jgi:hypothetical protein
MTFSSLSESRTEGDLTKIPTARRENAGVFEEEH